MNVHFNDDDGGRCSDNERFVSAQRRPSRLRVLVAHRSPMVAAGLASTLRRLPSCSVRVHDDCDVNADGSMVSQGTDLIFGDAKTAAAVRARALGVNGPKVVLVTTGGTRDEDAAAAEEADARISIDCDERELLDTVEQLVAGRVNAARGGLAPGALRRVREHVDARLEQRIDVDDMAAVAGLSPCHFGRAFKQSLGVPPHRYVMQRRIEAAARLIRDSGRKLAEIALDVGFCDQSHFSRLFASHQGMTPLEFRRLNR